MCTHWDHCGPLSAHIKGHSGFEATRFEARFRLPEWFQWASVGDCTGVRGRVDLAIIHLWRFWRRHAIAAAAAAAATKTLAAAA
jgi:hypothetical protein